MEDILITETRFANCKKTAEEFGESRNKHFNESNRLILQLLKEMTEINNVSGLVTMKFLLSQWIANSLSAAVDGKVWNKYKSNQTEQCNENFDLLNVIGIALNWYKNESNKSSERLDALNVEIILRRVIENWNKEPKVTKKIKLLKWPPAPWSVSGQFTVLKGPLSNSDSGISFSIQLGPDRQLKHGTSIENALKIIKSLCHGGLVFRQPDSEKPQLIWCGVELIAEEKDKIPPEALHYVESNRYGSIVFQFPFVATALSNAKAFILGTRKFKHEYSQVIVISQDDRCFLALEEEKLDESMSVKIKDFDWKLEYSGNKWTHPELVFPEELHVPFKEISLTFSSHICPTEKSKTCRDCSHKPPINFKEDAKFYFKELVKAENDTRILNVLQNMCTEEDYNFLMEV